MSKLLITAMEIEGVPCIVTALEAEDRILEFRFRPQEENGILGNVYLAHVEDLAEHIQSAFVEIQKGVKCYFSLKEQEQLIFASPFRQPPLREGDDILVQVSRDAMKGKVPAVTANLNFTGKYLVLTSGKKDLGLSSKLEKEERHRLQQWLKEEKTEEYGLVVRTNARDASKEEILEELDYLKKRFDTVVNRGRSRTTRSLLEEAEPFYLAAILDVYQENLQEIVVEGDELFCRVKSYLDNYQPKLADRLRHYQDRLLPLHKLYVLERNLEKARQEKVWLNSGGYLVIQQTEAFVSIDVNSGKYAGKKKAEETCRKINLEAAREIARQVRLRNLSGIILIDFINMKSADHREELLHVLQKQVRPDPVKTVVVDMTPLNIVEMTRRKVRRPLAEDLQEIRQYRQDF